MRLIFHGILRDHFGPHADMVSTTVADALEGFSRQVNWPADYPVEVIGFETEEKLYAPTTETEIHIMPAMAGGGGKFGKIILGSILVVAGILIPIPFVKNMLITMGVTMILSGIVSLFMPSPNSKSVNDPESSKYLPVNRNTVAAGTPIPLAWGIIDLSGHWLSLQSDSNNLAFGSFPATPT